MKNENKLIIIGAGKFAEGAYKYFTYDSPYEVVAFSVEKDYLDQKLLFDLPIVPFEDLEKLYDPEEHRAFVAVSYTDLNRLRTRLYREVKLKGFQLISYISSNAYVWHNVKIGENCFILENNVLKYHSVIGNNVIMMADNQVEHNAMLDDNCFITANVTISSFCEVGKNCFFEANSIIYDNLKIAKNCLISTGALILRDTEEGKVYKGNPAKAIDENSLISKNLQNNKYNHIREVL